MNLDEAPGCVLTFSCRADSLFVQATGESELRIRPVADSTFEIGGVEASVTFHVEDDGSVRSVTLHQNGDHLARRLEDWAPGRGRPFRLLLSPEKTPVP